MLNEKLERKAPYNFQMLAITNVVQGFKVADRGQLIMPCGTGKTLIALWIFEQLNPRYTLVLLPSLALLRQTKNEWLANMNKPVSYMCVCSERDIDSENDNIHLTLDEIAGNVSTDPQIIRDFLQDHDQAAIFSTYQSLESVADAIKGTPLTFGLVVCDEAHKTAGTPGSTFSLIHDNSIIPASKRLYMTATPRILAANAKSRLHQEEASYIADMSDTKTFGEVLHHMSFKEAIDLGALVDYKIVAIGVTDAEIQTIIKEGRIAKTGAKVEETAHNYALARFMAQYDVQSVISFHSSIKKALEFKQRHQKLFNDVRSFHVNGKQSTRERQHILNQFASHPKSIVSNARCLTEGVDIPVVDAVYFCDPKNSTIDIVQAAGRALRKHDHSNKSVGYIVIPLFHRKGDNLEYTIQEAGFSHLFNVIYSLNNHDERVMDIMKHLKQNHDKEQNKHIFLKNQSISKSTFRFIELVGFTEQVQNKLFNEVIDRYKLPWRDFENARAFAQSLNINSREEWHEYRKNNQIPSDIPACPNEVYKDKGWVSWIDWVGRDDIPPQLRHFRPFEEARTFARSLKLKYRLDWKRYARSQQKPEDIPACPDLVYKDKGWVSWIDWLGSNIIPPRNRKFLPFEKARSFAHSLGLKSQAEWRQYSHSAHKPNNIPADPHQMYKNKGWVSFGDWLGTGTIAHKNKTFKPFKEARAFARSLNLKSSQEWIQYCKSGQTPIDIPRSPSVAYKNKGWVSWGDWLGTGRVAFQNKEYLTLNDARDFVRNLSIKSYSEWQEYCKSGNKPDNIPANPYHAYKGKGWVSFGDWLGTDNIANQYKTFKPFKEARAFARSLNLKSGTEWVHYCKSGKVPIDIPRSPSRAYKNKGWVSWGDWLGIKPKK